MARQGAHRAREWVGNDTNPGSAPLWLARALEADVGAPLEAAFDSEYVIVGGGVTGLSVGLSLAESGADVHVLEAEVVGHAASGRNNGQIIPTYSRHTPQAALDELGADVGQRLNRMVAGSADATFALISRHAIECDAVQNGWIQPAHSRRQLDGVAAKAAQWQAAGLKSEVLSIAQVRDMSGSPGYFGGWCVESGGHLNPLSYARGLARAMTQAGGRVHSHSNVQALRRSGKRWALDTAAGAVHADKVLLATNALTSGLWSGLERSFVPVRSYQIATRPLSALQRSAILPGNHALSDTRGDVRGFHYDREGRLITGGAHALWHNARARAERSRRAMLAEVFPLLDGVEFDFFWDGVIAVSMNRLPHLHQPAQGLYAALAYSGRGLAFATALGPWLAGWMKGELGASDMPLPVTPIQPIFAHGVVRHAARAMRMVYGLRDRLV